MSIYINSLAGQWKWISHMYKTQVDTECARPSSQWHHRCATQTPCKWRNKSKPWRVSLRHYNRKSKECPLLSSNNKGMHQFQNKKIGTQVRMTEPVHDLLVTTRLATSILHKTTAHHTAWGWQNDTVCQALMQFWVIMLWHSLEASNEV